MQSMMSSRRIAFPLAILIHVFLFLIVSNQRLHIARHATAIESLAITILPTRPERQVVVKPQTPQRQESAPVIPQKRVAGQASAPQAITPPSSTMTPETKVPDETLAPSPNGTLLAQSALNAIGKMDKEERGGADKGLGLPAQSATLQARLSTAIDKHGAYRAGVIEEHVYPDGRREERVHSIFGDYCITYQSPSNPTDGVDTMQHGVQASVPHTCGHRFD